MVRGRGIAVIAVALMYQCAEITRIARGRGTDAPNACQASVYRLRSRVFIGLPWPMNAAGIVGASIPPAYCRHPGTDGHRGGENGTVTVETTLVFVLAATAVVVAVHWIAGRTGLPEAALLTVVGLVYAVLPGPNITLDPTVV